jgi:hypothetical protein
MTSMRAGLSAASLRGSISFDFRSPTILVMICWMLKRL